MNWQEIIDLYYPAGTPLRDIYIRHCTAVANKAIDIARRHATELDQDIILSSAMLHDIGIFDTNAPSIHCHGSNPYIMHGIIGANLLRSLGVDEQIAAIAERHTGAGLTADEIITQNLPLPHRDLCPRNKLERLICYADKFFSKSGDMAEKTITQTRNSLSKFGSSTLARFDSMTQEFSDLTD